jgi:hypothetical protein
MVAEDPAVSTPDTNPEPRDEEAVTQCKKPYRDAIDEIEVEMQEGYSAEQGDAKPEQKKRAPKGPSLRT